jgi:hypothetical protein
VSELKTLFASAIIAGVLAIGTVGASAAGPAATPSPAGKAYGFHAFFKQDITMKTHRGWLVVCSLKNPNAQPWLRAAHAAKGLLRPNIWLPGLISLECGRPRMTRLAQ